MNAEILLKLHFLHATHKRVGAVEQIEPYSYHSAEVGATLHFYVSGLAVHQCVALGRVGDELQELFVRSASDVIDVGAVLYDGSSLCRSMSAFRRRYGGVLRLKHGCRHRIAVLVRLGEPASRHCRCHEKDGKQRHNK